MRHFAIILLVGLLISGGILVNSPTAQGQYNDPNTVARLNQLEAELQTLRAEQGRLQEQQPKRLPSVDSSDAPAMPAPDATMFPAPLPDQYGDTPPLPTPATSASYEAATIQPDHDTYTLDELRGEMKKLCWRKGDFCFTPYGILWANGVYETARSNNGDYTLWVFSDQEQGEPTFHADGRNTRLGVDILGPKLPCFGDAQTGGKVEVDFQGQFVTENKGSLLLRHAYVDVKNEDFRLVAGQTWDVISPLNPTSVLYSVYWDAGNIGYRRAQFRGDRYLSFSDDLLLTLQGSINGNIVADTAAAGVGDQSGWPVLEGRAALTFGPRGKDDLPITVGVSSHIGEQRFTFPNATNLPAKTWSLNADFKVPLTRCTGFQGECFMGENLSAFLGGIGQGYDFTLRESIYSRGGWLEVYHFWTPCWHSHVGYCLDDPNDADISLAAGRVYNQAIFGNIIYDVTKQFQLGFEVSSWKTLYKGETPGESIRSEFMVKYGF
jgi:hypothetical protein